MPADIAPIDFLVCRSDLRRFEWAPAAPTGDLAAGEIDLRIARFAFTSNNITYARFGDALAYWEFFPAPAGKGRIPVWGIGEVVRSSCAQIAVGETIYGYLPMSTNVRLRPDAVMGETFLDATPHRAALARTYNEYRRIDRDPGYDPVQADAHLVLRPLFSLSFFLAEFLRDSDVFAARRILVTSASSKTAVGLAQMLRSMTGVAVIGLTSRRNLDFVRRTGVYHEAVAYEGIDALPVDEATVVVDMAGDAAQLRRIHRRLADTIRYSCLVGATHDASADPGAHSGMPGPKPEFFFTPDHILARRRLWGQARLTARLGEAWRDFAADVPRWLRFRHASGRAAVETTYTDVLEGRAPPDRADILSIA